MGMVDPGPEALELAAALIQVDTSNPPGRETAAAELIRDWLAKVPKPDRNWADDPDPPRYTD